MTERGTLPDRSSTIERGSQHPDNHRSQGRGVFLVGELRHGALGESYRRAFEALGLPTTSFDSTSWRQSAPFWLRSRAGHRLTIRSAALRSHGSRAWNTVLLDAVRQADPALVLLFNGHFVMPETVLALRAAGHTTMCLNADNPFPPHYNNRPETLPVARAVDRYLVWSEAIVERLRAVGVRAEFHPFGWDEALFPYEHPPATPVEEVVFIGGWDPERERFLSAIAERFPLRIWGPAYWGERTRRASTVRRAWQGREVMGVEAAKVIRSAAITLNVLRTQHYTNGAADGVIMRTFEVPGCGGFLLSTRSGGATRLFPEGSAAAYFGSTQECLEQISFYLNHPAERSRIAHQAHETVAQRHRYTDRAREILDLAAIPVL